MKRRDLMLLLGGAMKATSAMHAQEPRRVYRIGMMVRGPRENPYFAALLDGLRQ
jgi:hypothetical protein